MRAIGASEKMRERQRRQDKLLQARHEHLAVAGDQAVDQVEAGDLRRRAQEGVEPPERRRRDPEQVVEDVDQDQPGEEHRQRDAGGRDHAAEMIDERSRLGRGEDAERHRDQHRDDQAEQRQLGRGRQAVADVGHDRLAGGERCAEIAAREVGHVVAELHDQRLVEPELDADLLDRLLGRGGPREIGGRIAGQRARQQERDDDHADQARQGNQRSLEDHSQHRSPHACHAVWSRWIGEGGGAMPGRLGADPRPVPRDGRQARLERRVPRMPQLELLPLHERADSRAAGGTSTGSPTRSSASRC